MHDTLFRNGFGLVWVSQGFNIDFTRFRIEFNCKLKAQFEQTSKGIIESSTKCILYKHIKVDFKFENYLVQLPWNVCKYIVKLRTVDHRLAIETGSYSNIGI